MPVEEIINEIKKQDALIFSAMKERERLMEKLESADSDNYDWLSVKRAADIMQVSVCAIYKKIDTGLLTAKHIGAKKFVKKSEVFAMNDRYKA